jgi:hypothetical protein
MFNAARWRPLPKRRNASMAISACCRVALTMSKPPSGSRSSEIGAAGLALAALDHEGKLDPRHRREEANRRIAERMCETLGVGFPQKDGHERGGIDDHSAPHAGLVMADDLVRAAGVNIRQAAQCLPISHQPVSASHSSA